MSAVSNLFLFDEIVYPYPFLARNGGIDKNLKKRRPPKVLRQVNRGRRNVQINQSKRHLRSATQESFCITLCLCILNEQFDDFSGQEETAALTPV